MKKIITLYLLIITRVLISSLSLNFAYAGDVKPPEKNLERGKELYEKNCAQCHGEQGDGKGVAHPFVFPKPRDFTPGIYKIRSTPAGQLPLDEDLFRIITLGMPGSSMPAWQQLPEADRWQLVYYLKTFSDRFTSETPQKIATTPPVPSSPESIEKGKEFYDGLECWKCHGQEGRGDGPSAPELKDEWGFPVRPANLTKNWTFRGGGSAQDIYMRVLTGVSGTPMPSYADVFEQGEEENYWHLANYVKSFSPTSKPEPKVLTAKLIEGELPVDPEDPRWNELESYYYPLAGQIVMEPRLFTPSIDSVFVKSVHNGQEVAFLVMWDDPTQDPSPIGSGIERASAEGQGNPTTSSESPQKFGDRVAIQFPVKDVSGFAKPYFIMGDTERPINVWTWKAEGSEIQESNASGPTREIVQNQETQEVQGKGLYQQGQWRVVFKRPLTTSDKDNDIQFETRKFLPIAFSVWNGSEGETGLKRSVSAWYYLFLEAPEPMTRYIYPAIAFILVAAVEVGFLIRNRGGQPRS